MKEASKEAGKMVMVAKTQKSCLIGPWDLEIAVEPSKSLGATQLITSHNITTA